MAGATPLTCDDAGRLTSLSTAAGQAHDTASTYAYNPAGQVGQATRSNDLYAFGGYVTATRAYTVNRLNQYTQAGNVQFAHDANGNLSDEGSIDYTYDGENRLVGDNQGNAITYDPLGRLYSTSWPDGGVTRTTTFLYNGDELVGEYEGATQTARYVHGPGTDEPVVWYVGGATGQADRRFLYADRQGSIELVTYNGGAAAGINSYDEYGIPAAGNLGRFGYTGQIWLPNFGLSYYKARMYSPTTGRFLQVDPVGYDDQVNLYAYVRNDPISFKDPLGLCKEQSTRTVGGDTVVTARCPPPPPSKAVILLQSGTGRGKTGSRPQKVDPVCVVPPGGPGKAKLDADIRETMRLSVAPSIFDYGMSPGQKADWMISRVRDGGVWDFKTKPAYPKGRAFGDFHYGAVAAVAFGSDGATYGAHLYSLLRHGELEDQMANVRAGYAYVANGCYKK